jgi:hypothetical protein
VYLFGILVLLLSELCKKLLAQSLFAVQQMAEICVNMAMCAGSGIHNVT